MSTLRDFISDQVCEHDLTPQVRRYLDVEVVEEFQTVMRQGDSFTKSRFCYFMGQGANVYHWVLLKNGRGVGWNENPSHGWSFPVSSVPKTREALRLSNLPAKLISESS